MLNEAGIEVSSAHPCLSLLSSLATSSGVCYHASPGSVSLPLESRFAFHPLLPTHLALWLEPSIPSPTCR